MCYVSKSNVGQRCWCRGETKLTRQFQFQPLINVQATIRGHIMRWGNINRVPTFHILLFSLHLCMWKCLWSKSFVIRRNLCQSCLHKDQASGKRLLCKHHREKSRRFDRIRGRFLNALMLLKSWIIDRIFRLFALAECKVSPNLLYPIIL